MVDDTPDLEAISRNPDDLPDDLPGVADVPDDDPFADGVLMKHQRDWLADESRMKIAEKGRRTGITFAEALGDTLIAAASREDGGDNVLYIGDTKEKGREFIGYVAKFAKLIAKQAVQIEEFVFEDQQADGSSRHVSAFRIRFKSGYRVEALSSRPANIRGLQGVVVIDEAAFHKDVHEVLDAVNALLIWGGKVRVISTHNGVLNPFNELIREARAKKNLFEVHHIPFKAAVENGLYKRLCRMKGWVWSKKAEEDWEAGIRKAYGTRTSKMHQELDAIPAEAEGAALTRVQIESCMEGGIPVVRWKLADAFKSAPPGIRRAEQIVFCNDKLLPILKKLNPERRHVFGEDFARSGDLTSIVVFEIGRDLVRRCVLIVEMRNVPFDQQREVLYYVGDRLPKLSGGALDATGNGQYLAEKAAQRYGATIVEVKLSQSWYLTNMPPYIEAFGDRTLILPRDEDILNDHQALAYVGGIIKVPDDHRNKGSDGFDRHGDTAIAGALAYFASRQDLPSYEFISSGEMTRQLSGLGRDDDDEISFGSIPTRREGLW
ncbi:protein gp28 [Roseibium sp. TrichSKD4]|uniref:hypothetical protein n=1 Tax=Roseibium sp. TrichSKD4 TaxID=744980 RepID=UPI0001E5760A|nr:hypothetical protein [Roseibium sp. TrichSKD4]EFO30945.1 protein gp28 [Roseibium sp. TrichSKD4]